MNRLPPVAQVFYSPINDRSAIHNSFTRPLNLTHSPRSPVQTISKNIPAQEYPSNTQRRGSRFEVKRVSTSDSNESSPTQTE